MVSNDFYRAFYPDSSKSGTIFFYSMIHRQLKPTMVALNLGAGPGPEDEHHKLREYVSRVIAVDIDAAVVNNPDVDEAHVITSTSPLPLDSSSIDVIVSDYVFEHVEHPNVFLKEAFRVLKPGGRFFFRTPNLTHYVSLFSFFTPHSVHRLLANRMRGLPTEAHDPYPTFYRMNRPATLRSLATEAGFSRCDFSMIEGEPSYLLFNTFAFLMGVAYERLVSSQRLLEPFRANIIGYLGKE